MTTNSAVPAPLTAAGIDCKVRVGAHGSHGSIAAVTLANLPADQREVVAGDVHTLLGPLVMRHEVVPGLGKPNRIGIWSRRGREVALRRTINKAVWRPYVTDIT
jgi:hypothetical protein